MQIKTRPIADVLSGSDCFFYFDYLFTVFVSERNHISSIFKNMWSSAIRPLDIFTISSGS